MKKFIQRLRDMEPVSGFVPVAGLVLASLMANLLWETAVINFLVHVIQSPRTIQGVFFLACIIAPLWEEYAFRALPQKLSKTLDEKLGTATKWPIIGIASLLFGLGHSYMWPIPLLTCFTFGFAQAFVYEKTNHNYWAVVAIHAIFNFMVIFLL